MEVDEMREEEKIEAYLSSIRHDLRNEITVIREGANIILENLVGSNCETCYNLLRHTLKSTDQLNKLIGEYLTSSHVIKMTHPFLSAKEKEMAGVKKELLKKEKELEGMKAHLAEKEEELRCVKAELLEKEGELLKVKETLQVKEEEWVLERERPQGPAMEIFVYELMGMISHIVRTPLAVIKESFSLALDEIPGRLNEKQKEILSNGRKSVDGLIQSIEELSNESWTEIVRLARTHFSGDSHPSKEKAKPRKKILIVEDQSVISNMLKMRLEANHYDVITAGDGEEGLEKARKENPHLIILDIMLPKMNGYKVCQLLKSDSRYRSIPIIISSGRTPQEIQKFGKEVGADAIVSKPFDAETLLSQIKELLEKKKS